MTRHTLQHFNWYIDGRGFAGEIDSYTAPKLALITEGFRAGGMDSSVAIEMGMEPMESTVVLQSFDQNVLALWGVTQNATIACNARAAFQTEDGTVLAVRHEMRGRIRELEEGEWKAGEKSMLSIVMDLDFYRRLNDGEEIHKIDIPNMIRVINGVDQLEAQRAAIGR